VRSPETKQLLHAARFLRIVAMVGFEEEEKLIAAVHRA